MTLRTHIDQTPGRAATGRSATGAGSDVERDTCGRGLAPADEARPPRAGAAWPPRRAPARPQWLSTWARVPLAAKPEDSYTMIRLGSDWAKVGYGSAKRKYGVGSMDEVWSRRYELGPIRIASILSICARKASQERALHIGWIDVASDLELQRSRTTIYRRVGDLALRRRPNEHPVQPSADITKCS